MGIDLEHLRTWIGRTQVRDDPLGDFPAQALGAILNHDRRLSAGDALPPGWHWLYFLEASQASKVGPDGHPSRGDFLPPVPLPRRMWAAGSMKLHRPLRLGLVASKRSSVRSVDSKSGKSGELLFIVLDHSFTQEGNLCIEEEQTLVYRALPTERAAPDVGERAPRPAEWSSIFHADCVALFRFSAITFNAHRIHYDREYAIRAEFYPGLVVHAPLLVLLLLDLCHRALPATSLAALKFRALRPTFEMTPVQLHGSRAGRRVDLWTADSGEFIGVSASAELEHDA